MIFNGGFLAATLTFFLSRWFMAKLKINPNYDHYQFMYSRAITSRIFLI